jgi:hypothetical protein
VHSGHAGLYARRVWAVNAVGWGAGGYNRAWRAHGLEVHPRRTKADWDEAMFETPCLGAQVMLTKKRERAIMKQADQWTALGLTKGLLIAFSGGSGMLPARSWVA